MMLTIHGLPTSTNYQDLKRLIKQECHITDFILDSLVMDDDGCKKVRIGVTDDGEGSHLMKYLNGYHFQGHVIRVVPVGKVNQQNQGNFDARGSYQRNDYQQNNLGRPIPHDSHPRAAPWAPQGTQWSQSAAQPQNAFPQHPQTNNTFIHQQPRGFAPGGASAQPQSYGYPPKPTVTEHPITIMKDNFQGPTPYQHQPNPQGHFQGPSHTQTSQWSPQVQAVKPQVFDKPASVGYNPMGFNDNRQMAPKPAIEGGYKDYDKDRRFTPRDPSPGRRMGRGSPGPSGRLMSPGGQGRRMSPSGPGRRMSPSGPGRRISPSGPGRRMSPSGPGRRMSPSGPGRRISPTGPGRRMSPSGPGRRMSPSGPGRRISPTGPGRRISPSGPGRRMSPSGPGRRISPTGPGRRISPTGPRRRMSPGPRRLSPDREMSPGRRMGGRGVSPGPGGPGSPHARKMSPRRMSPGGYDRRMSPSGSRRVSPGHPGRRLSPSGPRRRMSPHADPGRMSPPGRRMSPGRRESSPGRRMSPPGRRRGSPGRRSPLHDEPGMREYPPSYQQSKKPKYDDGDRPAHLKQVRPAYEPSTKAPNQAMYSGGYHPNVHESVQYTAASARPDPWQPNVEKPAYPPKIGDRVEKFDIPRGSDHSRMGEGSKRARSGTRDSRSPVRRERSPGKDRYRRHSPSPRSPRRSWALEKRRSPDDREAPPPPLWPGQNTREPEFSRPNRQHFSDIPKKIEKKPNWEIPAYEDKNRHDKDVGMRPFAPNNPVEKWKPISQSNSKELPRSSFRDEERFSDNIRDSHDYPQKKQFGRPMDAGRPLYEEKRDYREYAPKKDDFDDIHPKKEARRDDFPKIEIRKDIFRTNTAELNKEIEDVYKRVAELGKKAQEYRKKESRFEDRPSDEFFDQNEETMRRREARREFGSDGRFQPREEESKGPREGPPRQRETRWAAADTSEVWRPKVALNPAVKSKRDKAAEELTRRIMNRFRDKIEKHLECRIHDELVLTTSRIFYDIFKQEDISYIELIITFNKKYDANDEEKIFGDILSSFSSNYRKRPAQEQLDVPVKTAKRSPKDFMKDETKRIDFPNLTGRAVPEWTPNPTSAVNVINPIAPSMVPPPLDKPIGMQFMMNATQLVNPPSMVTPTPMIIPTQSFVPVFEPHQSLSGKGGYTLYLCKNDFQPFSDDEADAIKTYLVSKMFKETETSNGWAPDFTMKGLQSVYRYEVLAHDEDSRNWLLDLNFSDFPDFSVLVYTNEELWYERAAIWLPGHSRYRHIEPLHKLKLQNKKLEGVNIDKWKFVQKVVTTLGTRIYVDMPPSSARALEKHKMELSYELQKVSVFMKAAAVDKDAFDAGLNEASVEILPSMHAKSPMPALNNDPNIIKIGLKGSKSIAVNQARKIKDMVVYQLFQYLLKGGNSSTDFKKFGYCTPGFLGVLPENTESKRWLVGLNIGKLYRQAVVVLGGDETNVRYIKMYVMLPNERNTVNSALACEKLKQSNQGVKGINFSAWKNANVDDRYEGKTKLEVHMDLESVETIIKLGYELDYVDEEQDCLSVKVKSDYSRDKLEELVKQYKSEMTDSYDVANMEIDSESEDDVICLD